MAVYQHRNDPSTIWRTDFETVHASIAVNRRDGGRHVRAAPDNVQRNSEENVTSVRRKVFKSGHGSRRLGHICICEGPALRGQQRRVLGTQRE